MAQMLGAAALPCALFALGANLARFRLGRTLKEALFLTALKTVAQPALVLAACELLHLPRISLQVLVTIAAMPAGVNAYLFAARYEAAVAEASSTILISTGLSVVTLSVLLVLLRG
jgi:malonate transporter and related proteins